MQKRYRLLSQWSAMLLAAAFVAVLAIGCADSTVAPVQTKAGLKLGHGSAFDMRVAGSGWNTISMKVTWAPAPYQPTGPFDSRSAVGESTSGKIIAAYRNKSGVRIKRMELVEVDNRTLRMTRDGRTVSTLADVFPGLAAAADGDTAIGEDTVEVCVYFENYVYVEVNPAYAIRDVAPFADFAALEPAALDSPKATAPCYVTDSGKKVPYYKDRFPGEPDRTKEEECRLLEQINLKDKIEAKSLPTDTTNCHGWTFTCGKVWIDDPSQIIKDNGYDTVKAPDTPQAGDIIVYKDADGNITHTGIVRIKDGKVVIDSKWGRGGRYCHSPEDSPYGGNFCYMRTKRPAPPGSTDPDKDKHTIKTM